MRFSRLNCLLPLILLAGTPAQALQGQYTIMGRVARPDDTPAGRVVVRISGQTGLERQILTDDLGKFEIRDLARPLLRDGIGPGHAEAIDSLRKASEVEPGNPTNYYFMGVAAVAVSQAELARSALNKALSIDPEGLVRARVHLASLLIREGRTREAAREPENYLEAVPEPFDGARLRSLLARLRAAP